MHNILNTSILLSALVLFGIAFTKICTMDETLRPHKIAAVLFVLASSSFAARVIFPRVVNGLWLKIATLSLIVGILLWLIGDRRKIWE